MTEKSAPAKPRKPRAKSAAASKKPAKSANAAKEPADSGIMGTKVYARSEAEKLAITRGMVRFESDQYPPYKVDKVRLNNQMTDLVLARLQTPEVVHGVTTMLKGAKSEHFIIGIYGMMVGEEAVRHQLDEDQRRELRKAWNASMDALAPRNANTSFWPSEVKPYDPSMN